jgi:hypothetical protein
VSDPFRHYPDWPWQHKLARFAGVIIGALIGLILLATVWAITFWRWLIGDKP